MVGVHDVNGDLTELRDAGLVRIGSGKIPEDYWAQPLPEDQEGSVLAALLALPGTRPIEPAMP
jgi:hypothetical protein